MESIQETEKLSDLHPYVATVILSLATFMEALDTTIILTALPKIASGLGVTINEASWAVGVYLVANAAIVPVTAWLATNFGRKRFYMTCVLIFTISSLLCAFANSIEALIFFRIIQGLSGGGLASSEQAIIADTTPPDKLGRAFSIYVLAVGIGPICGPTVGGFIADSIGWHWIFLINVPIGIVAVILTGIFIRESKVAKKRTDDSKKEKQGVDFVGIIAFILGVACLEVFFHEGPKEGWLDSPFVFRIGVVALVSLLIGITWEYYQKNPAVDISLFRYRSFASAAFLVFASSMMSTGSVFLFPFMAQSLFGYSAINSGLIFLPGTLIMMVVIQIVGILVDKTDVRYLVFAGFALLAFSQWNLTTLTLDADYMFLVWARIFQSFGLAFIAVTLNTSAYTGMPKEKNNSISAFMNLARNTGSSLGIAIASTFIIVKTETYTRIMSSNISNLNPNYTESLKNFAFYIQTQGYTAIDALRISKSIFVNDLERQAGMRAFIDAFQIYLVVYIVMLPLVFLLKNRNKQEQK
jgi:MFS transporter, DHA2 family, multidrug resistance protein